MTSPFITAHMVVKNEDCFVYYAIKSILPYVDKMLIFDTGSTDKTLEIISQIKSSKIDFRKVSGSTPQDITSARMLQLSLTTTPWIWIIDGDEVYSQSLAEEVVQATKNPSNNIIVVRRHDLLGDIYHAQDEKVGEYQLFEHRGHLVTRLVRIAAFPDLVYQGDYPKEGYYTQGKSLRDADAKQVYITTQHLYHAMYLERSSGSGKTFNRNKFKYELGNRLSCCNPPEVFFEPRPDIVPSATNHYSMRYALRAAIETPIKKLKRKLFS